MPGSTLRKSRGNSDAPPAAAHPAVPPADSGDLITLVRLVLSRMDDNEAASFAAQLAAIVGLYIDPPAHAVVLSLDEKSQIQALDRMRLMGAT